MQANPCAGRIKKICPRILCKMGQPDPLFASQVRNGPMRDGRACIATPTLEKIIEIYFYQYYNIISMLI